MAMKSWSSGMMIGPIRCAIFVGAIIILAPAFSLSYIMPPQQILQLMEDNFSGFKSQLITQVVETGINEEGVTSRFIKERLWIRAADGALLVKTEETVNDRKKWDYGYRLLFLSHNQAGLNRILTQLGIDIETVGLERFDGHVAYRIGKKEPGYPKLFIDKERLLPLFIAYFPREMDPLRWIGIRFKGYQKTDNGWYPSEINRFENGQLIERYSVLNLEANKATPPSFFRSSARGSKEEGSVIEGSESPEEERLRRIIRSFEEEYQ
jgi:hypothetical protein